MKYLRKFYHHSGNIRIREIFSNGNQSDVNVCEIEYSRVKLQNLAMADHIVKALNAFEESGE